MISNRKAFIVGLKSYKLSNNEKIFLKKHKPWGVILFSRNIKSINQTKTLTDNIKKSYRSLNDIEEKIKIYSKDLLILESDTQDIIEYVNQTNKKKKKKFNFWKLLEND